MSPKSRAEDSFVNVWIDKENKVSQEGFYEGWLKHSSARIPNSPLQGYELLRKEYPDHSLVAFNDFRLNLLDFPAAQVTPLENTPLVTNLYFISLGNTASIPGMLLDGVLVGSFKVVWQTFEFILYTVEYPAGFGTVQQNYVLHDGPEENTRSMLLSAGIWADKLHNEIWVFDQGWWRKDAGLWYEVQKADWKDVILKDEFKKALQKDVYGFYNSEELYKDLGIPWKRGLIMYGPPGNGKTISLKVIMKWCDSKGYAPLYVKSFQSFAGEEYAMTLVFDKARQLSPCVIILEDLDSLINDRNRSFFLNQLDGLVGNDGLLVIGTTNHFERLDPGISTRPSRFDRKYLFDDPDRDERVLYAQYWQNKLRNKNTVDFPDPLVGEIADATSKFSFAYLKEAFVSALVILAGIEEDDKPTFRSVILDQITKLRKQLDKPNSIRRHGVGRPLPVASSQAISHPSPPPDRDPRKAFESLASGPELPRVPGRWFVGPTGSGGGGAILAFSSSVPQSAVSSESMSTYVRTMEDSMSDSESLQVPGRFFTRSTDAMARPGSQFLQSSSGVRTPRQDDYRMLFEQMDMELRNASAHP
ncbi:atp-dependent zn protease [Moniliophthora roreri MCA 2997]|uniref:Atp-dependent zn protease n=2 Tax=Moniliophthora roreri TaxID=221103 RepID=V2XNJ9_MONRO|nr:atp-dependent zn protease [Moniliophthora roreri MCA 2997]KAI3612198.1 atp-dependent zn protease [Moniliophthora roreri]